MMCVALVWDLNLRAFTTRITSVKTHHKPAASCTLVMRVLHSARAKESADVSVRSVSLCSLGDNALSRGRCTITIGIGPWLREDRRDFIVILSERG